MDSVWQGLQRHQAGAVPGMRAARGQLLSALWDPGDSSNSPMKSIPCTCCLSLQYMPWKIQPSTAAAPLPSPPMLFLLLRAAVSAFDGDTQSRPLCELSELSSSDSETFGTCFLAQMLTDLSGNTWILTTLGNPHHTYGPALMWPFECFTQGFTGCTWAVTA